jgi:hypothetical protein
MINHHLFIPLMNFYGLSSEISLEGVAYDM